jgi:hypothetical protein
MIFHYINIYFNCFTCLSLGILLNYLFDRHYPDEYKIFATNMKNFFVNISYKSIYYYSKCQIFCMNIRNDLDLFVEENPILSKIKNGINKLHIYSNKYNNNVEYYSDYGFCIYNYNDNNIINKQLFYENSDHKINEKSDVRFMLIEFKNGENIYKIDLKTDKFNYYLVGNKFTKNFFILYIKTHINKNSEFSDDNNYTLKFIDHDVNMVGIDFTDNNKSILLEKNGYKITGTDDNNNINILK